MKPRIGSKWKRTHSNNTYGEKGEIVTIVENSDSINKYNIDEVFFDNHRSLNIKMFMERFEQIKESICYTKEWIDGTT
jgi:hypothetical protein